MISRAPFAALLWLVAYDAMADSLAPLPPSMELGLRLMRTGEASLALAAFNRAMAEDGPSAEALTGVSAALHRMGLKKEAIKVLKSAVELDPNLAVARNNLGVLLYETGDIGGAQSEFERAFALTGGADERISINLGIAEHNNVTSESTRIGELDFDFDLIQYGHGVYRLEPRRTKGDEGDANAADGTGDTP